MINKPAQIVKVLMLQFIWNSVLVDSIVVRSAWALAPPQGKGELSITICLYDISLSDSYCKASSYDCTFSMVSTPEKSHWAAQFIAVIALEQHYQTISSFSPKISTSKAQFWQFDVYQIIFMVSKKYSIGSKVTYKVKHEILVD